jgi:hypothetical protein
VTPAKISAASAKSSPRSVSVLARLTGSNVIRLGYCIYNNRVEQAMAQTAAPSEI